MAAGTRRAPGSLAAVRVLVLSALAATLAFAWGAPAASAANRWIKPQPLNIAHQGGEDEFPSNTMYAFRKAVAAGADMLELDVGVTRDNRVAVLHDTTVNGKTNGRGTVSSKTLRQLRRLDGAYWFSPRGPDHYRHGRPRSAYPFRGVARGRRKPPPGFSAADFRIPTLRQVMQAFPDTPINIEIKGRTPAEEDAEYVRNAEVLARLLRRTRRRALIVVSFKQAAVERFHELVPRIDLAPGVDGVAAWLLGGGSPGEGVAAFQVPITTRIGGSQIEVTTRETVARAHREGYAWQNWFSGDDRDAPGSWRRLVRLCVDGIMTAEPVRLQRVLRNVRRPAGCR
jgi:glycerophosphoryl diester phosphodiesterase